MTFSNTLNIFTSHFHPQCRITHTTHTLIHHGRRPPKSLGAHLRAPPQDNNPILHTVQMDAARNIRTSPPITTFTHPPIRISNNKSLTRDSKTNSTPKNCSPRSQPPSAKSPCSLPRAEPSSSRSTTRPSPRTEQRQGPRSCGIGRVTVGSRRRRS